jgi:gluconate 5-dehydrogenase
MSGSAFDLDGRVALVTGGGSGLGLAMATALSDAGARVVIVGRNADRLADAAAAMPGSDWRACDLTDRAAIKALAGDVGRIDILVNNAGIQLRAPIAEFPEDGWDLMIATHLSAPFFLARAFAPGMAARGGGKIINTLSLMAELGRATIVPYTAAKGGLRMLTRGLAVELGPDNIQVNGIAPGYFATEMNAALVADPEFDAWVKKRTPARRWGDPREVAGATRFFASAASDFVSGQVLFVDGGFSASV